MFAIIFKDAIRIKNLHIWRQTMLIDLSCPVENRGITVRTNSETGEAYLLLKLFNISDKTITSLNFVIKAFDENGNELATLPVELTQLSATPKEYFAENKAVSLEGANDAKNFTFEVISATFEDGEVYEYSEENLIECDDSEVSLNEALALRELLPDAVCYAKETDNYWRCACGRANKLDHENCVRCGEAKSRMLTYFSSKTTLANAIKKRDEEIERARQEEALKREAKKKKLIKNLIISGIVVLAVVILAVAGYFVRNAIVNHQANTALKNGDFLKAYELYSSTNNDKRFEIIDKVIGNTPSNLMYGSGFLAEDNDNLYFIAYDAMGQPKNLIKESKKTKDTTILTDAARGCLNVVGDKIYFINHDSFPCSMTKDGKTTEVLFETPVYYMCVVGSDLYYVKVDYDNPKGFTEEECQVLASQGQIESFVRIHKMNLSTRKSTLVSEENINSCSIYGDKIYFLTSTDTEDSWAMSNLMSMDIDGKNITPVIDIPVRNFFIKENALYYIPYYYQDKKGAEITDYSFFDCSIMELDLSTGVKTKVSSDEEMVLDFNVSGDDIIYIALDRNSYLNYSSGVDENAAVPVASIYSYNLNSNNRKNIMTGNADTLNVCGDDIFCMISYQGLARLTKDGSGFEAVYEDGTSVPPVVEETTETE